MTPASSELDAQTATTYEIGTRGRKADFKWDIAFYRAHLRNELQCLRTSPFSPCTVVNADRTVHQESNWDLVPHFSRESPPGKIFSGST